MFGHLCVNHIKYIHDISSIHDIHGIHVIYCIFGINGTYGIYTIHDSNFIFYFDGINLKCKAKMSKFSLRKNEREKVNCFAILGIRSLTRSVYSIHDSEYRAGEYPQLDTQMNAGQIKNVVFVK